MKTYKLWIGLIILALTLQACNLQLVESPQGGEDISLLQTITAQALILEQAGQTATPIVAPNQAIVYVTATADGSASATPETVIPAAVLPPATGPVTVTVSVATNCRQGPGTAFASVYGMPVGQVAKVVAKNSYSGYWIIEIPGQAGQTCWLWGQYAVINGDTSTLKEVVTPTSPAPTITNTPKPTNTVQPTATNTTAPVITKPNAPSDLTGTVICNPTQFANLVEYAISLTWVDNSNNEDNFNIATPQSLDPVSANTTSYNFTDLQIPGNILTVSVTAQNSAGLSAAITMTFVCP